uniref:Uncharacterized protein n=1 Tax=Neogobius melanostomus TaxID=47308 RepID=A0A8C6WH74_9GOBI
SPGQGTSIPDLPEVKRVKEAQKNISLNHYKDSPGQGTSIPDLPEVKRVKEAQKNIISSVDLLHLTRCVSISLSIVFIVVLFCLVSVLARHTAQIHYKESLGQATSIPDLPEVKRVKETQKNISLVDLNRSDPPR